mgnify:CR=1 FL=1
MAEPWYRDGILSLSYIPRHLHTMFLRGFDFVDAARASGASTLTIVRVHVLGNVLGPILVYATSLISVVTPFYNLAMPLIRYDIGDYAEAGAPCACGRTLPVLARIMGRSRNMLRLPGGGTMTQGVVDEHVDYVLDHRLRGRRL